MAEQSVHCIIVESGSGESGPLWGVVSDLDLVAAATVRDLDDQTAEGSAASPLLLVTPTESLERAAQLMTEHGTSHLVVVDGPDGRPVGCSRPSMSLPRSPTADERCREYVLRATAGRPGGVT